eukprot:comp19099_c0_seq1/m.21666 comp19099_c0_seq1/g.21666  ORF comp19099_c0_seq1/g.21666 comp19099_c0_seq1/m.21666 type:complete len:126 (-) comp19099_c0_seq1:133-510(-)
MAARTVGSRATRLLKAVDSMPPSPLLAAELVGSPIRNPPEIRNNLCALGLTRRHQVVIHKNTASVNGMLRKVAKEVDVTPLKLRIVSASEFSALYQGPSSYFVSSAGEVVVKQGSPLADQWAMLS